MFSAPNYCGIQQNKASIMKLRDNELQIVQFNFAVKKDLLVQIGDAFIVTMPIIHKYLKDVFLSFMQSTNEVIFQQRDRQSEINRLDQSILKSLNFDKLDENDYEDYEVCMLERLIH